MELVVMVVVGWIVLSVLGTIFYAVGARLGYRRGFRDGQEAAQHFESDRVQRRSS
ncbi:hypothetical protein [Egibacter rhizosphaerae]|uniref:hypothetical protein n=1 Tax=Egibacter rhizosphaerae TaxID=1670831 RepID=UPI0013F14E1E|nr:hypothetical protein [Egibacter rhizosphaerae]